MSSKKVMLKSSDGELFVLDEVVALKSQTIAHMVEDDCANTEIPLANVKGSILSMVIEYCKKHVESESDSSTDDKSKEQLKKWDDDYMKMDHSTLHDVILAANYLNIKDLLDLCCQTIADMIKGKTPDEIRTFFNIENDFTPEEEEAIRKENQWAFE